MPRYFNTTGPCDPAEHYYLPTAVRLPNLQPFFDRKQYFVLHAPRQTGKTTAMRTFADSRGLAPSAPRGGSRRTNRLWERTVEAGGKRILVIGG